MADRPSFELAVKADQNQDPETLGDTFASYLSALCMQWWKEDSAQAYAKAAASIVRHMVTMESPGEDPHAWESLIETFNDGLAEMDPWPAMELRLRGTD